MNSPSRHAECCPPCETAAIGSKFHARTSHCKVYIVRTRGGDGTNYLDDIVGHVLEKMNAFAQQVSASVPSIICEADWYSTDAYLLRSFVSLRAEDDGDELALTVNITRLAPSNTVSIESDLCMENGAIVASGPSVRLLPISNFAAWRKDFDAFLKESQPHVIELLKEMVEMREPSGKVVRAPGIG